MNDPKFPLAVEHSNPDSHLLNDKLEDEERNKMFPVLRILRKREFKPRESLMYQVFTSSDGFEKQSSLAGFYNLFILILVLSGFAHTISHTVEHGTWFNLTLFHELSDDFLKIISTWPIFTLWSFNAFFIQKLVIKGLSKRWMHIFQHFTQSIMFVASTYFVLKSELGIVQTTFIHFQTCIHFMKMHSYNQTNMLLREEWIQAKKKGWKLISNYPDNINLKDFWYYLVAPVLIYWYHYPRTPNIRWKFFFERAAFAILGLIGLYLIGTEIVIPIFALGKKINFIQAVILQMIPFILMLLIFFFTVWDCILFCIAELTRFADREFYGDWWNVTNYDEFNRKWNKIVHEFFFRHCFAELNYYYKFDRNISIYSTFFASALLHEALAILVFKKIKPFFLLFIMFQIPYIPLLSLLLKNKTKRTKNFIVWLGNMVGVPLIFVIYMAERFS